jgi:hypothetical protein
MGYYIASGDNNLLKVQDNLSVRNFYYPLPNNTKQRSSHLLRGGSLKSLIS